jgi:LPXTG-motif cell wall-anchored protein
VASAAGALALGVAGSAFACNVGDFTGSAGCDRSTGTATITVQDVDTSHTTATLRLYDGHTQVGSDETVVGGSQDSPGVATFTGVPWKSGGSWTVKVSIDANPRLGTIQVRAGEGDCTPPTTAPPTTAPPTTAPPTTAPPTTAPPTTTPPTSAAPSSSAPVVVPTTPKASASSSVKASTSPSASATASTSVEASASASPSGTSLATTGGGSDAGLFAGIGAVLIAAGGATVFFLRRRAAGNHA